MRRALHTARDRTVELLTADGPRAASDVEPSLRMIVERVTAIVSRGSSARASGPQTTFPPDLVDTFRRELLLHLSEGGAGRSSGRDIVAVLMALDDIVARRNDETPATFGERLAGLDALRGMTEIAHDMRSPLAAILLLVEPIRRGLKGPVTPVQERQLGLVYGAALSLSALANDIIEAARTDRTTLAARPFSIRATVDDACALVRPIAEEKRLDLQATYEVADARIGDAAALHRVVLNLLTNALKYTETGTVCIECRDANDTDVDFVVHDTGEGIPGYVLASLSDGLNAEHSNFRYSSSGLGLAICRALLEKMGSTLHIAPQPNGRGTRITFRIALPRAPEDPDAAR
jgi:signal transduction histidine kinase